MKRSGDWKPGQASPIGPFRHVLVTDEAGASLSLKFKGSEIGIIDVVDKDSADYEYAVDGAAFRKLAAPKDVTGPTMRPVSLAKGLDRKAEHELVLKVASPGTARMGGFLLNGTVADAFAGMSTLEKIDAIYAAMDPIDYQPPAGRFAHIPKTMSKLRDGGELRMVLLGDSIMGNTSGSSFELLLMRDYPKCKIIKIASLRSSTGCKYYREENRVQDYVLKHNPDLLVIGGISNGGDAEAVRSVVQQVRAKKPDTEVLLLTPVFGAHARRAHPDLHARDRHDDEQFPLQHAEGRGGGEMRLLRHDRPVVGVHPGQRQDLRLVHGRRRPRQRPRLPDHRPPAGNLVQGIIK